ncbi:MAG: hypothetical protein ACLFTI_03295 [Anaerolineales bacterium]
MKTRIGWITLSIIIATGMLGAALLILAPPLRAEVSPQAPLRQTTTTPTYIISDSVSGGVTYEWIEISDSGDLVLNPQDHNLQGDNAGSAPQNIGFNFPFFDNVYDSFRVSTNGYIYFDGTAGDGNAVPNLIDGEYGPTSPPENFIAPFGADLFMHPQVSRVYVEQQSNPRRTVIEFVDMQWCCGLNDSHTFEIILYPDGRILTQYRQIRYLSNRNNYVVAGLENAAGDDGAAYYVDFFGENTALDNRLAVLYDPGDSIFGRVILNPPARPWWGDPGERGQFETELINMTGITDYFELTYTLRVSSSVVPTPTLWPIDVPPYVNQSEETGHLPEPISNLSGTAIPISVTIPITAAWSDLATIYLTATAHTSPTITNTVAITYGVAQRDLSVRKHLIPDEPPAPGGYFRYRITAANNGYENSGRGAPAHDVQVTDTLPLSVTLVDVHPGGEVVTGTAIDGATMLTWTVNGGALGMGTEELYVDVFVPHDVPTGTEILNTAAITPLGSIERGPFDNNLVTHTTVITEPRLAYGIDKEGPGNIGPGETLAYTIRLFNAGNVPITNTVITDTLPDDVIFESTTVPDELNWTRPTSNTVVYTLATLRNGAWNAIEFNLTISVPLTTPLGTLLTNTIAVTTTAPLTRFAEASGDEDTVATLVVDTRPDVWVEKQAAETSEGIIVDPEPGGDYTFWINYGNAGRGPAHGVVLTDTLPSAYVTLLDAGPARGSPSPTHTDNLVIWDIGTLPSGFDGWTSVRVLIDENTPPGTQLINRATITTTGDNVTTTNDSDVVTVTLRAADVTVAKAVAPTTTLHVGDVLTYTVRVRNTGEISATGVRLTDTLPAGLTDVAWLTDSLDLELIQTSDRLRVWRLDGALAAGRTGWLTITGRLDPAHTWPARPVLRNQAHISTLTGEPPTHAPNRDEVTSTVAVASPYIHKSGPTLALPGEYLTYTLEYGNPGLLPAEGVRLTDTLPVSTSYVTHDGPITFTTGSDWVAWEIGALPSQTTGVTFTLVLSVSADAQAGIFLENRAELASTSYDGDLTDNISRWRTPVGFDLSGATKRVNGASGLHVGVDTPVTYTIILPNAGPYDADNVRVHDPIPTHTAYISNSAQSTGGDIAYLPATEAITWTGAVSGNHTVTLTFQVTVADAGPLPRGTVITNTAAISDGVQTFFCSAPVTITGPNLEGSTKSVSHARPNPGETITYTIVLSNSGEATAQARMEDDLPAQVTYHGDGQATSGDLGTSDPITWTGEVTPGGRVTITLPVEVVANPGVSFQNTAHIYDGTGVHLQRSVEVSVTQPILDNSQTTKKASAASVLTGERIAYTVTIYNDGSSVATSAMMTDVIQGGVYAGGAEATLEGSTLQLGSLITTTAPTITWQGPLGPGQGVVIRIPVTITAAPGSDVTNVAQIYDGVATHFTRTTAVHVIAEPNLAASTKRVDRAEARAGETLTYTLTVSNSGELPTPFAVTDTLDVNTAFSAVLGAPLGDYGHANGVFTWTGVIDGESEAQLAFQAQISATATGIVTNTAHIGGAGVVYTRAVATTLLSAPLLTATKSVQPVGPILAGDYLTYTIVMQNLGDLPANTILTDTLPPESVYVNQSAEITPAGYAPPIYDDPHITWDDNIPAHTTVTLTFQVRVQPDTISNTIVANEALLQETSEPGAPFTVAATNTVVAPALRAAKMAAPRGEVVVGERLTYTVVMRNVGSAPAHVELSDPIPTHTTYVTNSAAVPGYAPPSYDAGADTLAWADSLAVGEIATLTYQVDVTPGAPAGAVITNAATIQELSYPDDPAIFTEIATHTLRAPTLLATKTSTPTGYVGFGETITYTLALRNPADGIASVELRDPIPTHTTYVSDSVAIAPAGYPLPAYAADEITWQGEIGPRAAVTLTFAVTVNQDQEAPATITNTAQIHELSGATLTDITATNRIGVAILDTAKRATPAGDILPGMRLTYTIPIRNIGSAPTTVQLRDAIPTHTTYVLDSLAFAPAGYAPPTYTNGIITWRGTLSIARAVTLTFAVDVAPDAPAGVVIRNIAEVTTPAESRYPAANTTVRAPEVTAQKRATPADTIAPGDPITYTLTLTNTSAGIASLVITDTIPLHTTYTFGDGDYNASANQMTWQREIEPYSNATLHIGVIVTDTVAAGTVITNTAQIQQRSQPSAILEVHATHTVQIPGYEIYLPLIMRQ